jgi:DNA-binding MarR family transcriptional regulator
VTREVLSVLSNDLNLRVFDAVAQSGTVRLKDLEEKLEASQDDIENALNSLEEAGLITSQEAPRHVEDFRISYPTTSGLSTRRQLRRLELAT